MALLYGFANLKDLAGERVTVVGERLISDAVNRSLEMHNQETDALLAALVTRTTDYKIRYRTAVRARLQPLDNAGRALPIKRVGHYDVAFPLQQGGIAFGWDDVTMAKATVQEVNDTLATVLTADLIWLRDHILAALFTNVSWTFADEEKGDLTVQPLANSDTVQYLRRNNAAPATDTHFLAQAGAIADLTNPFPTIYAEITEHPENSGQVISLIPTANKAAVQGLTEFKSLADANIRPGANTDVVVGGPGISYPGELFGYLEDSKIWCVEWPNLPDNYLITFMSEGDRPLAMREDPEESLRGYTRVAETRDYPWWQAQYRRRAGFGAYNRVGAVIQRVGNAAYAIPTGYSSPMA